MVAIMMLAAAINGQQRTQTHVRTTESTISALIEKGVSQSSTFRRLVDTLNASDVIVYIEPKLSREALGGFLQNDVLARGGYRYLRVALDMHGSPGRVIPILAHELQHAVEVAENPDARSAEALQRLFARLAIEFACNSTNCSETQAAKDVEEAVKIDLKTKR
jgi:hypothetical protein